MAKNMEHGASVDDKKITFPKWMQKKSNSKKNKRNDGHYNDNL